MPSSACGVPFAVVQTSISGSQCGANALSPPQTPGLTASRLQHGPNECGVSHGAVICFGCRSRLQRRRFRHPQAASSRQQLVDCCAGMLGMSAKCGLGEPQLSPGSNPRLLDLILVRRLLRDGDEAVPERLVVLLVLERRHVERRQQLVRALRRMADEYVRSSRLATISVDILPGHGHGHHRVTDTSPDVDFESRERYFKCTHVNPSVGDESH